MITMMITTSEELDDPPHQELLHIIYIYLYGVLYYTSEELDDPPHHPGAWTLSRVNSTGQHHELLSLIVIMIISILMVMIVILIILTLMVMTSLTLLLQWF